MAHRQPAIKAVDMTYLTTNVIGVYSNHPQTTAAAHKAAICHFRDNRQVLFFVNLADVFFSYVGNANVNLEI
jgi:hypothetical protein